MGGTFVGGPCGDFTCGEACPDNFPCTNTEPCGVGGGCPGTPGEGDCVDNYDDTYNGGCNSPGFPFSEIGTGVPNGNPYSVSFCGSYGNFLADDGMGGSINVREQDWIRIDAVTTPGLQGMQIVIDVVAEDEIQIILFEDEGSSTCQDTNGDGAFGDELVLLEFLTLPAPTMGETVCGTTGTLCYQYVGTGLPLANRLYVLVQTPDFVGTPCGTQYELDISVTPCDTTP